MKTGREKIGKSRRKNGGRERTEKMGRKEIMTGKGGKE